jgi:hypothetical protein
MGVERKSSLKCEQFSNEGTKLCTFAYICVAVLAIHVPSLRIYGLGRAEICEFDVIFQQF